MKSLIIFFFPVLLFAQSEFMDSSGIGFLAAINYSASNDLFGFGGEAGVSLLGIFDLGLQYTKAKTIGSSFNSSGNLVYFAINSKRMNEKDCVKLLFGYANESLTHDYYGKLDASGPVVGIDLFIKASENEIVTFMPELGIIYGFISIDNEGFNGSGMDNTRNIALALNVKLKLNNNLHLLFSPTLSKDINSRNAAMFGINAGVSVD
jgi:hypothetical protein